MSETTFTSAFGSFEIKRVPHRKKETLRAWDAADILLLDALHTQALDLTNGILIVNDYFAALTTSLSQYAPINWSDSWISHQAMRENLRLNKLQDCGAETLDSVHVVKQKVSVVLIKVPKSMALFEYQLLRLKPLLQEGAVILVAGMVKHMPSKVWSLLEKIVGETNTHRAARKGRVIEVSVDTELPAIENPYPLTWPLEGTDYKLINHANVFAREHLDIGTRFFLKYCPQTDGPVNIIDLACGNGVIGLMTASKNKEAHVLFTDESYMAIASAKENVKQLHYGDEQFDFHVGDGLHKVKKQSADIILCNPPFHQHHSIGETMALTMFAQAAQVLKKDGALWVVSNRHLGYPEKLSSWFLDVSLVASSKKFVVLKAAKPKQQKKSTVKPPVIKNVKVTS
ncbi:MAG: methyltransferase [Gammaproteobacteria bacterium]|nr:methyltransferase [Gammaproteobacteria bacterium]